MAIANFTPDPVNWMHIGITGTLEPDSIQEFDPARENHILNNLGKRGIVAMKYGDDEEEKRKEAMATYKEFWLRQIQNFNRDNEIRRNENRAFVEPQPDLEKHAKEFGIELIGPWRVAPTDTKDTNSKIKFLQAETDEMRQGMSVLSNNIGQLQDQIGDLILQVTSLIETNVESSADSSSGGKKKKKGS